MAMHGVALMNAGYGKYAYPPDRTWDPRVKAYVEDQEQLRVKLVAELGQSEFKEFASEERIWTNYEYMEVFDQLAQFVCNRYPLNSKWRKLGPTDTLNDVEVPTKDGSKAVKLKIDTVSEHRGVLVPILLMSTRWRFLSRRGWCRRRATRIPKSSCGIFIRPNGLPSATRWRQRSNAFKVEETM